MRTRDDLGSVHADAARLDALLGMAVQYACGFARSGTVVISADGGAPGSLVADTVLFTVTCSGRRSVAESEVFAAPRGSPAAACVGLGSLAPGLRGPVEEALRRPVGAPSAHERTYNLMRSEVDVRVGQSSDLAQVTDAGLALTTAPAQAAALEANIGVATFITETRTMTRFWLLLPRRLEAPVEDLMTPSASEFSAAAAAGRAAAALAATAAAEAEAAEAAAAATVAGADFDPIAADAADADGKGPLLVAPAGHTAASASTHAVDAAAAPAIRHVMLVDDEVTLRRLGARMLDAQGVECDALEDGCEVAGALKPEHELLLLDIVMRQSDGVEVRACASVLVRDVFEYIARWRRRQVCTELRKSGVTIPIVAMTGNVDPASIEMYKGAGFDGMLAKPFSKVRRSVARPVAWRNQSVATEMCDFSVLSVCHALMSHRQRDNALLRLRRLSAQKDMARMLAHFAKRHGTKTSSAQTPTWWMSLE